MLKVFYVDYYIPCNSDILIYFPTWIHLLVSFFCLIALARLSNTQLKNSDHKNNGHELCLILQKNFLFTTEYYLAMYFIYRFYYVELCFLNSHIVDIFKL